MAAHFGPTNPPPDDLPVKRFGAVVGLDPEKEDYYRKLHADVWPTVLDRIHKSNMRNYSIYVGEIDGKRYLFSYFEYVGSDYAADMQAIAADPETRRWWAETAPCQFPLPNRQPGEQWLDLEMVFFAE